MVFRVIIAVLLTFFLFLFNVYFIASEDSAEIPVYTYHTHAPFIISNMKGLSYDLAAYLAQKSGGKYNFTVIPMSRARVDKMINQNDKGIVPWVNPAWFQDKDETKYMWTDSVLMKDGNTVISNSENKINYRGPDSVLNLRFGGVRNHHYTGIDDYVDSGRIKRYDADNHIDNFRKLVKKRIDFTITPLTGALFLIKTNKLEEDLYISDELHSVYKRRIIISDRNIDMKSFLEESVGNMNSDPDWIKITEEYE